MDLHNLTITSFSQGLRDKKFKAFEVVEAYFKRIQEKDKDIGAYLSLHKDAAYAHAETVDLKIAKDEAILPLSGVPLAIKDAILVQGERASAGSKILENYIAAYDATVIKKLRTHGALFLGKTNMDEFAMGSSTENSAFFKTKNPHDLTRVPGGSSGGSAAAVAAHMALGALGSDTGGSIREPSAFCGTVGLKTTYGAVSRFGLIAMASSLDQIGPMTKTVEDAELLFKAIAGSDSFDATAKDESYEVRLAELDHAALKNMTIGIPEEYFGDGIEEEVRAGVESVKEVFKNFGIRFKSVKMPHTKYAISDYYIIMPAEVSSNLARFDGMRYGTRSEKMRLGEAYREARSHGFGTEAKRRIILGTFVLSSGYYDAYYAKAQKVRALIKQDFENAFRDVDILLTPVTPTRAFSLGEKITDPLAMYMSDVFTVPANLAGVPAISIPVHGITGLPIGFQLIGKHWQEQTILSVGRLYENLMHS